MDKYCIKSKGVKSGRITWQYFRGLFVHDWWPLIERKLSKSGINMSLLSLDMACVNSDRKIFVVLWMKTMLYLSLFYTNGCFKKVSKICVFTVKKKKSTVYYVSMSPTQFCSPKFEKIFF